MRFIDLGIISPEYSVCADRAIFESHYSGITENTLHIYTRDRPSISVGRFQDISETVKDPDITIVRRISGGGTIYSDGGQITYALTVHDSDLPTSREAAFEKICSALVIMFKKIGIDAVHKPVNDILCNNRKISGSAQYRDGKSVMQHGSILLSVNNEDVDKHLTPKKRSYDGLISMKDVLGHVPDRKGVINALISAFEETFSVVVVEGKLTADEKGRIEELMNGCA